MLTTALRVLVRCWPALLAWFLLGWTVRALILQGAGYLLNIDENVAILFLPLAILAQLAAFVGMFFAIRRELPHLAQTQVPDAGDAPLTATRRWRDTLVSAILPFFLLYVAWNLVRDDVTDLYFSSLNQSNFGANDSVGDQITIASVVIMVVAFCVRLALGRFANRLPRWVSLVATYFEAVWVFVALTLIRDVLAIVGAWLSTRRLFGGLVDFWAELRADFGWIGVIGDGVGWTWAQIGTLIGLPLAWLAFAAIIYVGNIPRSSRSQPAAARAATERWQRMPVWVQRGGKAVGGGVLDRWQPVALAARLIWRSGPVAMGTYLLAFAVITAGAEWLRMFIYRLVGPHPIAWWYGASDVIEFSIDAVFAVVQVCVVAAAFDHALRSQASEELSLEDGGDAVSSTAARAAATPTT